MTKTIFKLAATFAVAAFGEVADVTPLVMPQPRTTTLRQGAVPPSTAVRTVKGEIDGAPARVRDQAYKLEIAPDGIVIVAPSAAGERYAHATLDQLRKLAGGQPLPACTIVDWPALRFRGFMNDYGRNYQSLQSIRDTLDLMAAYKLNLFHWHLTDYHGWRLESKRHPQVNRPESMQRHVGKFYTQEEFKAIVRYAAARGILVVPELDIPGHSEALRRGLGVEKMHTPGVDRTVCDLIDELCSLVPAAEMPYVHLGTDEVWYETEKVPDEWYQLWANQVNKNGRTVVGWWPGHFLKPEGPAVAMVWGQRGEATNTPYAYFDTTKTYYLNHMEPEEILRGAAYQKPCRWGADDPRALGALISVWHDDIAPETADVWSHIAIVPGIVMLGESFWRGDAVHRPDLWAHAPEASDPDAPRQAELERRVLAQRDRVLGPAYAYPFQYVAQTAMRWRVVDQATGKVLAQEMAGATITPRHWLFKNLENKNLVESMTGCYVAETWIKSETEQRCGAWIGFTGFSRSSGRKNDKRLPALGEWSRHGAQAFLNGTAIPPPAWGNPGAKCTNETPFTNEEYYFREPTPITLRKGWNHVRLVVPKTDKSGRWTATFVPLLGTSAHPREVPGLAYSATPPKE